MSTVNIGVDEALIGILPELQQPINKAATKLIVLETLSPRKNLY
jgi:hypothetical protein